MMSQLTHMLVKFNFFEHTIYLNINNKSTTHSLALVKLYKPVKDHKIRYYCQVDDDDIKSCNVELWSNEFYKLGRDSNTIYYVNLLSQNFILERKCKNTWLLFL